jgi:hypothetical protein
MSTNNGLSRWFSLSDGTRTVVTSIYEALNFSQSFETIGGASTQRMLNGALIKQTNWQKLKTVLTGSGGIPLGMSDLDFTKPLTLKSGATRSIIRPTNSFPVIPPHRTDEGYTPQIFKLFEGRWIPQAGVDDSTSYLLLYYPQINCFAEPPQEGYAWDAAAPTSWSITAEEI